MAQNPWYTSQGLIDAVKRKISIPISQNTFSTDDILAFANEEMMISQVPSVMSFHEEFFVWSIQFPLVPNQSNYPIPERAVGMKLRNIIFKDQQGNTRDMTRIQPEDANYYERGSSNSESVHKFYLRGNDVVLVPTVADNPTGSLVMDFFLRPNQLVDNSRAAIIQHFVKSIIVNNIGLNAGDNITIAVKSLINSINNTVLQTTKINTFTATNGSPGLNEFQIGGTSIITATNLAATLVTSGLFNSASNGSPNTATVDINYDDLTIVFKSSNTVSLSIQSDQTIEFDLIPTNITNSSIIDFLETRGGHRTRKYDIKVPSSGISGKFVTFNALDVPTTLLVGDYICSQYECIIPQIPTDLHNGLAERTSARILESIGDYQGLQAANGKIQEIGNVQSVIMDNRSEGTPQKISLKHSLLRYIKTGYRY